MMWRLPEQPKPRHILTVWVGDMGTETRQRWQEMAEVSWSVRCRIQGHGAKGLLSKVRLKAKV